MPKMPVIIINDGVFRLLWESDLTVLRIAKAYGVSGPAIHRAAKRFGLRPRKEVPEEPKPAPAPMPKSLDEQLLWTGGRWTKLGLVAAEHGMTLVQVQAAYHKALAAQPKVHENDC